MAKMRSYGWGKHHEAWPWISRYKRRRLALLVLFVADFRAWLQCPWPAAGVLGFLCPSCVLYLAAPACQVPRVPGHLELMAGGGDQTLNPRSGTGVRVGLRCGVAACCIEDDQRQSHQAFVLLGCRG